MLKALRISAYIIEKWPHFNQSNLNIFAIFLEFSIMRRVGTERNDNFYFLSFSAFFNLFWLKKKP